MDITRAVKSARRVYLVGNGGSAANAIHIANDLISCGVKAHALTADVSTLTAIANDYSYADVFSALVKVFGEPSDLLIALSGSGNSPNVLRAIEAAKDVGMHTFAVVGAFSEAKAAEIADEAIVRGETMQEAEEYQVWLGHEIMRQLKKERS